MKHLGQVHCTKTISAVQKSEQIHLMLPLVSEWMNFLLKHLSYALKAVQCLTIKEAR